jgi:HlyD family secretion protein
VATLITKQKIAQVSLNEVDITKIKSGQKVNITFDAIENLNITGQVLDVDLVGTVSQGVVSYNVKIGLDIDDERIKSGMSVSASIITDIRQDVVSVPVTANKNPCGRDRRVLTVS